MYTSSNFSDKYLNQKIRSRIFKENFKFIKNLKHLDTIYEILKIKQIKK